MFETRKELFSKISSQEAEINRLETELAAAELKAGTAAESHETIAGLNEDLESAQATIKVITDAKDLEISTLKASLSAAEAKITPDAIQALVTAQIAGSGHPPLAIEASSETSPENTKTRAQFEVLTHKQKNDFILNQGGKIVG